MSDDVVVENENATNTSADAPMDPMAQLGAMLGPGGEFEVGAKNIRGIDQSIFLNIPPALADLYKASLKYGDDIFVVYEDDRWSFKETYLRAAQLSQQLISRFNIEKGDRVALASRNYPEWVVTYMAVTMAGAVIVPMNSWWLGSELEFGLTDSGAKLLFGDKQRIESLSSQMAELNVQAIAIRCPELSNENIPDVADLMAGWESASAPQVEVDPEDWATMLYTSGSTGNPKGVVSTHRNVLSQVYSIGFGGKALALLSGKASGKRVQTSMLLPLPLFHVTGCNVQFLPSFLAGRKLVMMYKWDAGKALELIEREKINSMTGVPTMGQDLIEHPDFSKRDVSSLKDISSGGAAKPPEQVRNMAAKAPKLSAGVGYGLTEVNGAAAALSGDDYLRKPASCGKAIPPLNLIKVLREDGSDADLMEWGEVCIKGPGVMKGYWNRPEATAEVFTEDGWFKTGDIGYLDEEAFLFLVDRAKDLVIRGGENIGCAEVEGAIALHDSVMEVAVYGLPDDRLGEIVAATVMLKPQMSLTEEELQAFLKDKISGFKIPDHIWFQSDALERGATEKIFKRGIREKALENLKATPA